MGQAEVNAARREQQQQQHREQVRQDANIFIDKFEKFIEAIIEDRSAIADLISSEKRMNARAALFALLTSKS